MAEKIADLYGAVGMKVDSASFSRANELIGTLKKGIAAFVGFKITQGITNAIGDVIELGGHFNDASQKTGVAAENLQAYSFAAEQAGASSEEVITALGRLNKGLAEAATTGKGPAADALKSLGIGLNDPAVKAQNLDEILLEISDKFHDLPNGPKKVAAAMDLFGKAGANLIPFLNQGGDGIEAMKNEARELGIVLDEETIGGLDDLGDNIDKAKAGWQGFKNQAVAAIAPLIAEMMPTLIGWMKQLVQWARDHKTEIAAVFYAIGAAVKFVFETAKRLVLVIIEIVKFFVWLVKHIIAGIITVGKWFAKLGASIVDAFRFAFDWVLGKARAVWDFLVGVGRGIVDAFVRVGHGIVAAFRAAFDWVIEKARAVGSTLRQLPVLKQLGDLGEWIGGKLAPSDPGGFENAKRAAKFRGEEFNQTEEEFNRTMEMNRARRVEEAQQAPSVPAPAGGNGPVSVNQTINVTPSPGMNEQDLARKVGDVVDERMSAVFRHVAAGEGIS